MTFGALWFGACFPVALLIFYLFPPRKEESGQALRVPFFSTLQKMQQTVFTKKRRLFWLWAGWTFFVLSGMRPQFVGKPEPLTQEARELIFAIDISGSMAETDFSTEREQMTRLDLVKKRTVEFLHKREGDKVGLIFFGSQAFMTVPPTFDLHASEEMLNEIDIGMAGQQTALPDAIGLALKSLKKNTDSSDEREKTIVLISDGVANAGRLRLPEAVQAAVDQGVKIYTIGLSPDDRSPSLFSLLALSEIDEESLQNIANETKGKYFRASNSQSFENIYREIDRLEPIKTDEEFYRPVKELFYIPLLISLFCFYLTFFLKKREG